MAAMKTAFGLIYKKLSVRDAGEIAKRSDTVMVRGIGAIARGRRH